MQTVKKILSSKFNEDSFEDLIKHIFNNYLNHNIVDINKDYIDGEIFKEAKSFGILEFGFHTIGFFNIEVGSFTNKSQISKQINQFLKYGCNSLLVAYTKKDSNKWLLCYVDDDYKSYYYEVGQGVTINTPLQRLELLSKSKDNQTIDTLKEAFSVEALNKEFYSGIYKSFEEFRANIIYPSNDEKDRNEFIVRLIGRVLFLKFLEKKDIVPSTYFNLTTNYYHNILEPLFYETLNKPIENRLESISKIIPFLNGGLFDNQKNDFYEYDKKLQISKYQNTLIVPDDILENFLNHLNHYNFTIDENIDTSSNELSLDPELLGLVFENLLAYINPETQESARKLSGSYYTPREIVSYMVSSSLLEHLKINTTIDESKLKELIFNSQNEFEALEKNEILSSILKLKILDPSCGSGAFPMGILNKVVALLDIIDIDGELWFNMQSKEFKTKHQNRDKNYIRKLSIIQNSIFGVDISPIAIEISKLRFFLSLIVDEDSTQVEPLPNLEFKFVCANTLIPLENKGQKGLITPNYTKLENRLKKIKKEYFFTTNKKPLKLEFLETKKELEKELGLDFDNQITSYNPFDSTSVSSFFDSSYMFQEDNFNLIIGNPPYIRQEKIKELKTYIDSINKQRKKAKLTPLYYVYNGTADIYVYFFERAYQLLAQNGVISYIVSNKYTRAKYGKNLREFILSNCDILEYIDFNGVKVFESATVDTSIILLKKLYSTPSIKKENSSKTIFNYSKVDETYQKAQPLIEFINQKSFKYNQSDLTIDSFSFANPKELKIKKQIEKIGTPLKEWEVDINYGIKTGFNEAFIINGETKDRLIAKDSKSAEIIKPLLRGRDIKRYSYSFADKWLINSHNGIKEKNIAPIDIEDYPAIKNHLDSYYDKLAKRSDKGDTPYNLRNCAYINEFEKEKIIYPETVQEAYFYHDINNFYIDKTAFILIGNNLKYIFSFLSSKLITYFYKSYCGGVLLGNKGYQYNKHAIEKLPIPKISKDAQKPFEDLVTKIMTLKENGEDTKEFESQIDKMVYKLYDLSEDDIAVIEGVDNDKTK